MSQTLDSTKQFYNENAIAYSAGMASLDFTSLWDQYARLLPGGATVLDLGCGGGRDLKALAARGLNTVGLDYSEELARISRAESGQEVLVADIRSFNFPKDRFDGMWTVASLLHIPRREIGEILRRAYVALKVPGLLLTSMQMGTGHETSLDGRFFELYSVAEWETLLTTAGFRTQSGDVTTVQSRNMLRGDVTWFVTFAYKKG